MVVYLALLLGYDWRLTLLACLVIPVAYAMANWLKKIVSEKPTVLQGRAAS